MSGAPTPEFIPEAFAIDAAPGYRNTIPVTTIDTQLASFDLGFPPLTMLPVVAGGKPMLGPDMNGILYMLSSHAVYAQTGQPYKYSADVVVAIVGYAVGTLLGSTDGLTLWINRVDANITDPDDVAAAGWVSLFSYGSAAITGLVGGSRTLTVAESAKRFIVLTGALVANQQIVLPAILQSWLIINVTTGSFTTTVKTATQSVGIVVPAGGAASPTGVYGNGTDINLIYSPAALPIDVNATPDTIPLRDNTGRVLTVTPVVGDNTTYAATTEFVRQNTIGSGAQIWSNPAGRAFNTTYTNITGRPIQVVVSSGFPGAGTVAASVAGIQVSVNQSAGTDLSVLSNSFIVPAGATYILSMSGAATLNKWAELS